MQRDTISSRVLTLSRSSATVFDLRVKHVKYSSALVYTVCEGFLRPVLRSMPWRYPLDFVCSCVFADAVPKKRGPKTDVLEALLKRVDGLEAKLKEKNTEPDTPTSGAAPVIGTDEPMSAPSTPHPLSEGRAGPSQPDAANHSEEMVEAAIVSPTESSEPISAVQPDALLDTYFTRFHAKPFYVLDESTLRQRLQLGQVPGYLIQAIYAVAAKYTPHPNGYQSAVKLSEDYASRSRSEIDTDEPSIDGLQALMLLVIAFTAAGRGKKAYMLLSKFLRPEPELQNTDMIIKQMLLAWRWLWNSTANWTQMHESPLSSERHGDDYFGAATFSTSLWPADQNVQL